MIYFNKEEIGMSKNQPPPNTRLVPFKSIKKTFNSFNNQQIQLQEAVDQRKLQYLIDNFDTLGIKKIFDSADDKDLNSQLTILKKYAKKIKDGRIPVKYKQNDNMGRYFAKQGLSLQNLSKTVRHTISGDLYWDIDIDNAHPVILAKYCDDKKIPHENLTDYIENRERLLKKMAKPNGMNLDRTEAKKKILSIMNGGILTNEENIYCPHEVRDFYNEMLNTRKSIMEIEKDIVNLVTKKKKNVWNLDGCVMNRVLCDKENEILLTIVNYFKNKNFSPDVLVFDGCMIRKNNDNPEKYLKECSEYVNYELGININLSIKEMNEGIKVPDDYSIDYGESSKEATHYELAKLFYITYGKDNVRITSQKNLSCFIWSNKFKLWVEHGLATLQKKIHQKLSPIYQKKSDELTIEMEECLNVNEMRYKFLFYEKCVMERNIKNLGCTPFCKNVCLALGGYKIDPLFETEIINKIPYKIPIKNGKIINLKTLEIKDRTRLDYWSFEMACEYLGEKANLSDVLKFFSDISCGSKELIDYHRRLWGYLMTGEISDRSLHIFWGDGCNGKSSVVNIFKNITSKFTVNLSEDFMLKKTTRGASPEMMDLLFGRCGVIPESDKKEELNSKRIKTMTGSDVINARHLFGHPLTFQTQMKPIWSTNFKPKINIDDKAILDRLKLIPFLGRFEKTQENTDYIHDLQKNKLDEFFTFFCTGARDWYNGQELIPCKDMKDEMNKYIIENDVVAEFVDDTYDTISDMDYNKMAKLDKNSWVMNVSSVYCDFCAWISENNRKEDIIGKKDFKIMLFKRVVQKRTTKIYNGCLLKRKDHTEEDGEECILPL